jgi:hypothetical protein
VGERGLYRLPGPGGSERGPGPDCVAYVYVFFDGVRYVRQCVVLKALAAIDHLAYEAATLFPYFPLAGPPLLGDRTKFFHWGPNPLLVTLRAVRTEVSTVEALEDSRHLIPHFHCDWYTCYYLRYFGDQ